MWHQLCKTDRLCFFFENSKLCAEALVYFLPYICKLLLWLQIKGDHLAFRFSQVSFYACLYSAHRSSNFHARIKGLIFYGLGVLLPLLLFMDLLARSMSRDVLDPLLGSSGTEALLMYLVK